MKAKFINESKFKGPSVEDIKDNIRNNGIKAKDVHDLIKKIDADHVEELIQEGLLKKKHIEAGLIDSAITGNLETLKIFSQYSSDYNEDDTETNLLYLAVRYDHYDVAKYLLEELDMDPNVGRGFIIAEAAENGELKMIKLLENYGADLNIDDDRPFLAAVLDGNFEVVKYLVRNTPVSPGTLQIAHDIAERKGRYPPIMDYLKEIVKKV